jgi:hypothetical protein
MERYTDIEILKTETGRRFRKTVKYPVIEPSFEDTYIIGMESDRLDNLAWKYYKDPSLWWIIARANGIGKGDLSVPVGSQIRIPANTLEIVNQFNELNQI